MHDICSNVGGLFSRAEQLEAVMPLLVALRDQGLGISLSVAQILRETLDEGITPPVADLLAELSSGELIPIELDPRPKRLNWKNRAQVVKKQSEFCTLARERKLEEGLTSKKVRSSFLRVKQFSF